MRGSLASPQETEHQSRLAEVPKESRLHRWVAAILPQDHRPAPTANTVQVTGSFLHLLQCSLAEGSGHCAHMSGAEQRRHLRQPAADL